MNLQVCVPYQKCVYSCPMCIAKGHKHNYEFENLYDEWQGKYEENLRQIFRDYFINDIVITGECEPTQNMKFVKNIISVSERNGKSTELQTHNYNLNVKDLKGLNVLSYSITNSKAYLKSHSFPKIKGINRLVILLTKDFEFLNKENFDAMGYNQITFKVLQHGEDEAVNKWIDENKLQDLSKIYEIIEHYNGSKVSVRIDTSCMNSKGRYYVFRSDGKLYENWEAKEPIN